MSKIYSIREYRRNFDEAEKEAIEETQEENIFDDDAAELLNDEIIADENSEITSFDDGVSVEMSDEPEFDDGTSDIKMEFQDGEATELFTAENTDTPDYDIWLSDTIRSGLSINGTSHGNGLYLTFRNAQDPIYAELGGILLDDVPLSYISASWYNLMNHDFYDNQKLIYEALIMNYLKYSDTKASSSFDTSQIDRANSYLLDIFDDLAGQFLNEGINNWTPEQYMNLSVEDAAKYFERVSDMKKTVGLVKKAAKNTKELVTLAVNMRALEDAKEERVQMLTYARNACADMSSPNQDFINACDEILAQLNNTSIDVSYVINSTATKGREKIMDSAWGKLCDASPVLKVIDRGAGAMDIIFNTSDNAANNLKLELLYTMDNYFRMGLNDATLNYQYDKTSENASAFNGCFEGYVEFQMYGNNVAKSWIGDVEDGGVLNHAFTYIFYRC